MIVSYEPFNSLYGAAKNVLTIAPDSQERQTLKRAVEVAEEIPQKCETYAKAIELARKQYAYNSDVEIDEHPFLSSADGSGVWVSAWVWISCKCQSNEIKPRKTNRLATFSPFDDLYTASRNMLALLPNGSERDALKKAICKAEETPGERSQYESAIKRARRDYCDNELEIDGRPFLSVADDGVWVSAWVWIPEENFLEAEEDAPIPLPTGEAPPTSRRSQANSR